MNGWGWAAVGCGCWLVLVAAVVCVASMAKERHPEITPPGQLDE